MKKHSKPTETLPLEELIAVRKEAARRLQEAEAAAKEIADLCDRASKAARNLPHAGMGGSSSKPKPKAQTVNHPLRFLFLNPIL